MYMLERGQRGFRGRTKWSLAPTGMIGSGEAFLCLWGDLSRVPDALDVSLDVSKTRAHPHYGSAEGAGEDSLFWSLGLSESPPGVRSTDTKGSWSALWPRQTWLLLLSLESLTLRDRTPKSHCRPRALVQSLEKRPVPHRPSTRSASHPLNTFLWDCQSFRALECGSCHGLLFRPKGRQSCHTLPHGWTWRTLC